VPRDGPIDRPGVPTLPAAGREGLSAGHPALHPDLGIITRQAIRRGTFTSVKDLIAAIGNFIDGWNDRCEPFTWTKTADQIMSTTKVAPKKPTTNGSIGPQARIQTTPATDGTDVGGWR
jgi:hypothetical protein